MANSSKENLAKQTKQESSLIPFADRDKFSLENKNLVLAIGEVNKLLAYQLDRHQLVDWAIDVIRLTPGVEPSRIQFMFDCYKTERLIWDNAKGIQNIFAGLKMVYREGDKYVLRTSI